VASNFILFACVEGITWFPWFALFNISSYDKLLFLRNKIKKKEGICRGMNFGVERGNGDGKFRNCDLFICIFPFLFSGKNKLFSSLNYVVSTFSAFWFRWHMLIWRARAVDAIDATGDSWNLSIKIKKREAVRVFGAYSSWKPKLCHVNSKRGGVQIQKPISSFEHYNSNCHKFMGYNCNIPLTQGPWVRKYRSV
jgi:hypothetical protein